MDVGTSPMEKVYRSLRSNLVLFLAVAALAGCSSKPKVVREDTAKFKHIDEEYSKVVQVEAVPEAPPVLTAKEPNKKNDAAPAPKKTVIAKAPIIKKHPKWAMETKKRLPELEDTEGFDGRRPVVDPFRPGEKVTLSINYFNVTAGDITMEVQPFKLVNGRQAYHLQTHIKSNSRFSFIYAVDNRAETFLDYETLIPQTLTYHANETKWHKEIRTFFDWDQNLASQWRHQIGRDKSEIKKKLEWKIEPYSQNILSALYYLRTFTLTPGKKLAFRVADDGKNYVFKGEVLRREEIETPVGKFNTVVVRPEFTVDGGFKPAGENLIWLTDDDRKFIVRIEAKVKIGTLVGRLKALEGPK